ncbi:MAG: biotin synthase BioB [Oscillospiraceae bacterium]|nr:biotin synthase BioB [Oscillospiraceae bacterium]
MSIVSELKSKLLNGGKITRGEAISLINAPLGELCAASDEIRERFCGDIFDMCTIINGKSGRCSENCKYCAQSAHYNTLCEDYPLLSAEKFVEGALYNYERGVLRYSIVCSGKRLSDSEVDSLFESVREIKKACPIKVCVSAGLLDEASFRKLKEAGVDRVHNNLESSRGFFPEVCTTHTFDDKITAIKAAKAAGLEVCSGGIIGLGETFEDRIDMVLEVRELGVKSVPVNVLNPIPNTPFAKNPTISEEEAARTVAISRFLIPDGQIRLAGGRGLLSDMGKALFRSGANAAISGDMLTTRGISIERDMQMCEELGYKVELKER